MAQQSQENRSCVFVLVCSRFCLGNVSFNHVLNNKLPRHMTSQHVSGARKFAVIVFWEIAPAPAPAMSLM